MQPAQPQADPCESNLISIFGDDTTLAAPSDVLLNFIERQCLPFAQQSMASKFLFLIKRDMPATQRPI